jgi:hypothetical protein
MTLKIQVIAGDRHKNVAGLSPVYTIEVFHQKLCKPVSKTLTDFDRIELHPIFLKTLMNFDGN